MRRAILLLWAFWMVGCASTRHLPQVLERVERDTVYLHQVQHDSILVYRDRYVDRSHDTLYVQERNVEYHYRLLRDTLRIHQVDSVPVIREVEIVREVVRTPWYYQCLAAIGLLGILLCILKIRKSCNR